jgi:PPOX class probable F420-dependent enzyme
VIWLSSIRPDRRPHLLPVWFSWDGRSILVFSKPHAQKVRNLRVDPRVMVAIGQPGLDFDVELVEATAELCATLPSEPVPAPFVAKYAASMAQAGITADKFRSVYSQPIRIKPERWLDWGGRGWVDRPGHPAFRPPVAGDALSR